MKKRKIKWKIGKGEEKRKKKKEKKNEKTGTYSTIQYFACILLEILP